MTPSPSPDERLSIGTVLDGRYRIDAVLGSGGMGRVYRGEHTGIGRVVAIKVLHADLNRNREAAQRFQREAIASGRLDHPNIVGVSDFGVLDDGACFLVMEALEGESLGDRLARERRLPWREALAILRGVLAGLRHAHERGVVHRDIKPDNVFLARKDGDLVVKILDFGIAKLYAGTADDPASTRAGLTVGTPAYLSPEQAVGGEITPASDIYSTSILLFEALTGRAPFEDKDPLAMLGAHVGRPPPALLDVAPDLPNLPAGLEEMIQAGLVKTAADRIPSATDYLARIDAILSSATATGSAPVIVPQPHATPPPGTLSSLATVNPAVAAAPSLMMMTPLPGSLLADPSRATRMVSLADAPEIPRKYIAIGVAVLFGGLILAVVLLASRGSSSTPDASVLDKPIDKPTQKPTQKPQLAKPAPLKEETIKSEPPPDPIKSAPLAVALQELVQGKTCGARKAALARLVELDEPSAITAIRKSKYRMYGGVLGLGQSNANDCLVYDVDPAIKQLAKKLPPPRRPPPKRR